MIHGIGLCVHDIPLLFMAMSAAGFVIRWLIGCCVRCCDIFHGHKKTEVHEAVNHGEVISYPRGGLT